MSFTAKGLADLMYAYIDQSGVSGPTGDVTNATPAEKASIALCMTQAVQEARKINPKLFSRPAGITLRAANAGTITVTQYDTAVTLGTLVVPNDGCTVRIAGGFDNELNKSSSDPAYKLAREFEGASGTFTAQIWNDCWVVDDGTTYSGILGAVKVNGRPIAEVTSPDQLDRFRLIRDYGAVSYSRQRTSGLVAAVMCEQWASPYAKRIQTRLRFAPMPASATVVEAVLVVAAPVFTATDILSTEITFQIPQQIDELLLFPLAMKKFRASPMYRCPKATSDELETQYKDAVDALRSLRGHYSAHNRISVRE